MHDHDDPCLRLVAVMLLLHHWCPSEERTVLDTGAPQSVCCAGGNGGCGGVNSKYAVSWNDDDDLGWMQSWSIVSYQWMRNMTFSWHGQ